MTTEIFSNLQSQILAILKPEGSKTFEEIQEETKLSEATVQRELDLLLAKGTLKLENNKYVWNEPLKGNPIILEGNLLLPLTVIKFPAEKKQYVSRGKWYELPIDFPIRQIIWNVKLENKTESTLVDLIKSSIVKGKKTRVIHLPEYDYLRNKAVPYCPEFKVNLDALGEELTAVTIYFRIPIKKVKTDDVYVEHMGFNLKTEILTKELCDELNVKDRPRDWNNIKLNRIYKFSDFITTHNEIPVKLVEGQYIEYIRLYNQKGSMMMLETYTLNTLGTKKKVSTETMTATEAFDYLRDVFNGLPKQILLNAGFNFEEAE